jgi:hypothetical protein
MNIKTRQCESRHDDQGPFASVDEAVLGRSAPALWRSAAVVSEDTDQTTLELKALARILIDAVRENMRRGETN